MDKRLKDLLEEGNRTFGILVEEKDVYNHSRRYNFDGEQERHFRKLCLIAKNDGQAYRKRDARLAVKKASSQYIRNEIDD
jgi:hypothetical protein